ncbi:MAG: GMC family oxidoreductase N-terminal domain-containing protein [Caulobacterales bacterium]
MAEAFDYIIVGAGSAGCVMANRLSVDPRNRVLLLESGGENKTFLVDMPKGLGKLVVDPKFSWQYQVGQARGGKVNVNESWVRGRGLGGSSAVNGMIYVRGQPADYEIWAREAGPEWGWSAMKQAFRAIEDHELGDNGVRGVGGPVHVAPSKFRYPLAEKAIQAGEQMGLKRKDDLNEEDQEGVGYYSFNIKNGKRQSASVAFLDPIRSRPNLKIVTGVDVDRVLFTGRRASGVACRLNGEKVEYSTDGEIILATGAVNSPKLLQLSGIGPAALLQKHGIEVVQDSPDVGRRLLEHLGLGLTYRLKGGEAGINHRYYGAGLALSVAQYMLTRTGPMAVGAMEVGAFVRVSPNSSRPDAQLYVTGITLDIPKDSNDAAPMQSVEKLAGMTVYGQLIGLESEGALEITSPNPDSPLDIKPNWLTSPKDRQAVIDMVHYIRRYVSQPALATYIDEEMRPGADVVTDEQILAAAERLASCGTHAVRTCRMGKDEQSVVDERLRVRGVHGLRIADCSVMPGLISGNTNAPAMATGWRASDLILEDARLRNAA